MPPARKSTPVSVSKPKHLGPTDIPPHDEADIAAAQSFSRGEASPEQQERVWRFLLRASGIGAISYRSDPCETAFMEGRRFIGITLVHFLEVNLAARRASRTGESQEQQ